MSTRHQQGAAGRTAAARDPTHRRLLARLEKLHEQRLASAPASGEALAAAGEGPGWAASRGSDGSCQTPLRLPFAPRVRFTLSDTVACVVCLLSEAELERPLDWVFDGCGHCCVCKSCLRKLRAKKGGSQMELECPLCRMRSRAVPLARYEGSKAIIISEGESGKKKGQNNSANQGVLRPSLKGTKAMKQRRDGGNKDAELRAVAEVTESESPVTNIVFGQERQHQNYILLAVASKDGIVVIYRCYRTEMEIAMLSADVMQADSSTHSAPPTGHPSIAVHSRLVGHSRCITSCSFNLLEDHLVTTSIDKSVRLWAVDSGEMLKVFTDSTPVTVAIILPFAPQVFVCANAAGALRLVNMQNGTVLQEMKVQSEVRALQFDDTGQHLFAGTKSGNIHTLEASESSRLKFKHNVGLSRGSITCLTFVPAAHGMPACLLANSVDSNVSIVDCTYSGDNQIMNLQVRHRVRVAHSLLPLKCCHSPSGQGYLISGSEDKDVCIYSLFRDSDYKMHPVKRHAAPVIAVAVNKQDTLLASADCLGRVVLWRRMDYSHLPD